MSVQTGPAFQTIITGSTAATLAPRPRHADSSLQSSRVGAVVAGGDFLGLGIVRSLGRRGVPLCVIDDEYSISRFSRYCTRAVRVPNLRDEMRIVEAVLDVGRRFALHGWVLYPTREEMVAAFSRWRSVLAEYFRVTTPQWSTTQWAWDKRKTHELANRLGIPTPQTWYPANATELGRIDADPPLVIKPAVKQHFIYATKAKAWKAHSRQELIELFHRAASIVGPGEVMVQEFIPDAHNRQYGYCTFFKDGRSLGSMVARYWRQHPSEFGRAATSVETVELPLLGELSERFLRAIDYYGLAELEYRFDPRDGQYKLLDVNARAWGYHSLGGRAGVDFASMLFADQVGHRVEACVAEPGIKWTRVLTDVPTGFVEALRRRTSWGRFLRSLRSIDTEAVFSRTDPFPGLAELALVPYLFAKRGF
jgi:predicted ATP-grasp superfamily ATP-dependent carboligase